MIQIKFTTDEIEKLNYERYHYPHPKVQKKMEALYLKSQGLPHNKILRLCHISESTLTYYLWEYIEDGILSTRNYIMNCRHATPSIWGDLTMACVLSNEEV